MHSKYFFKVAPILLLAGTSTLLYASPGGESVTAADYGPWANPRLESLAQLSLQRLRARPYGSRLSVVRELGSTAGNEAYSAYFHERDRPSYRSWVGTYNSDGQRVYARIDLPTSAPPTKGYPVLVYVHGWIGAEAAPNYDFDFRTGSPSSRYIEAFADAGFAVISPALRGHGTVNDAPADGIEFLHAWDNGSYLSPMFYAIDVLNLLDGLSSLEQIDWSVQAHHVPVTLDRERIYLSGHSQGGDAALTALAVAGEGSELRTTLAAGSIWSGCFAPRFEQLRVYGPMASTLEAFMSGDGSWTGTANGKSGHSNPNFIFGWPPDWIGTVNPESDEWAWQADTWSTPTVADAWRKKLSQMYQAINTQIADIDDAAYSVETDSAGRASIKHDPRIQSLMHDIDAFAQTQFLTEPLALHHSDQDYYSLPEWNSELAARIESAGGTSFDFTYPQNTHSLLASKHEWFSRGPVIEGFPLMVARDLVLFSGQDPRSVKAVTKGTQ